ncbi:hypothetical protein AVEN_257462-1 [Araneus ventricosus]|uniref:Uncharacterized protein n=1 Tax=Araneus ventricosus TaxID=182803 RepID=A0A4Y2L7T8_ARAVE|nr:hypothetical protein AVEN_257462-1 [Araneus ventricosus]
MASFRSKPNHVTLKANKKRPHSQLCRIRKYAVEIHQNLEVEYFDDYNTFSLYNKKSNSIEVLVSILHPLLMAKWAGQGTCRVCLDTTELGGEYIAVWNWPRLGAMDRMHR